MTLRLDDLQSPALLIRLDRVRNNLAQMMEFVGGQPDRWRPHVKSSKIPEVLDLVLDVGVRNFKCATSREAVVLLSRRSSGLDLLVAMAHRGANLRRVADIAKSFPDHRVSVLTEDKEHAHEITRLNPDLGIFVDLDPGFHRTRIPFDDRTRIASAIAAAGNSLRGLHCYDGHLADLSPAERAGECEAIYDTLIEIAREMGGEDLELITSGTPTFPEALRHEGLRDFNHKISPGTVVYWDVRSESLAISGFQPAASVLARIMSSPEQGLLTCDAGSKALDASVGDPCAQVEGWEHLEALHPSEEHLPIRVLAGEAPPPGTLIQLVPAHVCPTVNLADQAVLMEEDQVVSIVDVAARGHEVTLS